MRRRSNRPQLNCAQIELQACSAQLMLDFINYIVHAHRIIFRVATHLKRPTQIHVNYGMCTSVDDTSKPMSITWWTHSLSRRRQSDVHPDNGIEKSAAIFRLVNGLHAAWATILLDSIRQCFYWISDRKYFRLQTSMFARCQFRKMACVCVCALRRINGKPRERWNECGKKCEENNSMQTAGVARVVGIFSSPSARVRLDKHHVVSDDTHYQLID